MSQALITAPRAAAAARRRGRWELWLDDGSAQRADEVVLALGNPPPAPLAELEPIAADRYVDDPWSLGSWRAREHRERAAGRQRTDHDRRRAAPRGDPAARAAHPRALAARLAAANRRPRELAPAIKPDSVRCRRPARRCASSCGARALAHAIATPAATGESCSRLLRPQLPALWQGLGASAARTIPAAPACLLGRASPPRAGRARWPRCGRSSVSACSRYMPAGSKRCAARRCRRGAVAAARRSAHARLAGRSRGQLHRTRSAVARHPDPLVQVAAGEWMRADALGLGIDIAATAAHRQATARR